MARFGLFSRFCALAATLLFALPGLARAEEDDVGWPYRGPAELRTGGSSDEEEGTESGPGDGTEDPNENPNENPNTGPAPGGPGSIGTGPKATVIVGDILWSWWWEHNKDRFLDRATQRGRINPGSALYWFGSGAKYPPRDITPVTASQRRRIFDVLAKRLEDKSLVVRKSACIALGRLGSVPANETEAKAAATDDKITNNMCARVLLKLLRDEKDPDLRLHALLGLGLTGDAKAGQSLLRIYKDLPPELQPGALVAFGLARLPDAIPLIVEALPMSARSEAETELAAIHALGLYGPAFVEEIEKAKNGKDNGIEILKGLATSRSAKDPTKAQAITSLARLQTAVKEVSKGVRDRSVAVKNTAILVLAEYASDDKDSETAWKALKSGFKGSQQTKNFVILSAGDLASRLQETSKTREQILKWLHDKKQLGSNDNYTRACSALALGVAGDKTAVPEIADMLQNTTIDHYVAGACSVALGLLKAADKADLVVNRVVRGKFNADAKGYGLIGLALMGDTTRVGLVLETARKEQQKETARQAPLAIGVLGDRHQSKALTDYFARTWKQKDRYPVSNAAFGQAWIRDADSVENLLKIASTSPEAPVRAMAAIALGYVGAPEPVSGLTRCFASTNYKKEFVGFQTLYHISEIL